MKRLFLCMILTTNINGIDQLRIGNLALPTSQQSSPLFAFGQNIIDRGDIQFVGDLNGARLGKEKLGIISPGMLWGISDNFSLYWASFFVFDKKNENTKLQKLEGMFLQGEYACYTKKGIDYINQITSVFHFFVSSGEIDQRLPLNFESNGLFWGWTASHIGTDWYYFISPGIIWSVNPNLPNTRSPKHTFDVDILYQAGLGHNIGYSSSQWLATFMVEFLGSYDRDLEKNILFAGPSLWFATQRVVIDVGIVFLLNHIDTRPMKGLVAELEFRWKF